MKITFQCDECGYETSFGPDMIPDEWVCPKCGKDGYDFYDQKNLPLSERKDV